MELPVAVTLLVSTQMMMLIFTKRATADRHVPPLSLCQAQFVVSAALSGLMLLARRRNGGKGHDESSPASSLSSLLVSRSTIRLVWPLSLCWTLGFVLFNASASAMSPSYVNLIRCGEPLATALVGTVVFRRRYSLASIATLVPIVGGVALASPRSGGSGSSLSSWGILTACASNVSFCLRPFFVSGVKKRHRRRGSGGREMIDDLDLFFHVTVLASSAILPPMVAVIEGRRILKAAVAFGGLGRDDDDDSSTSFRFAAAAADVLLSSVFFFTYQYTQLIVMSGLTPLAFSILTPVVKAAMIVLCSVYFGDEFGLASLIGVLTTTFGGYLFTVASRRGAGQTAGAGSTAGGALAASSLPTHHHEKPT